MIDHHYEIHDLEWRGIRIEVRLCRSWSPSYEKIYGRPMAHLEIKVIHPKQCQLPMTDTGYYSHFRPLPEIEALGGPVAYVKACLDHEATSKKWKEQEAAQAQLSLFD